MLNGDTGRERVCEWVWCSERKERMIDRLARSHQKSLRSRAIYSFAIEYGWLDRLIDGV